MRLPACSGSVVLHVCGIAALLLLRPDEKLIVNTAIVPIDVRLPVKIPVAPKMEGGGGGRDVRPASRGRPPRAAVLLFTPMPANPIVLEPALAVAPGVDVSALPIGVAFGVPGPPSAGLGKRGGIGDGDGPGAGPGVGGAYSIGAVSTAPVLIHKVDPEFSEEARRARFNGVVLLRVIIDERGRTTQIEVLRQPGLGLGERAVASVAQWRFRPGMRDGKAVSVWATVEVNFSLL